MRASPSGRLIISLALVVGGLGLGSCSIGPTSQPQTDCAPGLFAYKGGCLDRVSQNFVTCTETRGNDLSVEDKQKFGLSIDAGIKGGAGGVVEISKKVVETELPDVALEIVRNCLELSKAVADPAEQSGIDQQINVLEDMLGGLSAGTISLDPAHGPYRQRITVSGTDWPPNIEMEVSARVGTSKVRTTTGADGSFSVEISLDPTFEDVAPLTVEIEAQPVKPSLLIPATALYQVEK